MSTFNLIPSRLLVVTHGEPRVRCIEVFEKEARVFCAHSARKPRSQVIAHARPAHDVAPHAVTHALAPHGLMLLLRRTTSPATPGGVFCACGALVSGTISLPPTPGDVHLREEGLGARGVRCMRLVRCVVLLRCDASGPHTRHWLCKHPTIDCLRRSGLQHCPMMEIPLELLPL